MVKKIAFLVSLLIYAFGACQVYEQEDVKTRVRFKIKNFGVNVDGQFAEVDIQTNFNSKDLASSYIWASIKVKSISTGIESRDEHILEEDYFDEENFKLINLESSKIVKIKNQGFMMTATLSIKGTVKEIIIPLKVEEKGNSLYIQSNFEINRKDFKVGGGSFIMSKKVKIEVEYLGTKSS